jgi:hypothetical protein
MASTRVGRALGLEHLGGLTLDFWLVFSCIVAYSSVFYTFLAFGNDFLQERYRMTASESGRVVGLVSISSCVLSPTSGLLLDKVGGRPVAAFTAMASACTAFALLGFSSLPVVPLVGLAGVAYSILPSALYPMVAEVVPDESFTVVYAAVNAGVNFLLTFTVYAAGWVSQLALSAQPDEGEMDRAGIAAAVKAKHHDAVGHGGHMAEGPANYKGVFVMFVVITGLGTIAAGKLLQLRAKEGAAWICRGPILSGGGDGGRYDEEDEEEEDDDDDGAILPEARGAEVSRGARERGGRLLTSPRESGSLGGVDVSDVAGPPAPTAVGGGGKKEQKRTARFAPILKLRATEASPRASSLPLSLPDDRGAEATAAQFALERPRPLIGAGPRGRSAAVRAVPIPVPGAATASVAANLMRAAHGHLQIARSPGLARARSAGAEQHRRRVGGAGSDDEGAAAAKRYAAATAGMSVPLFMRNDGRVFAGIGPQQRRGHNFPMQAMDARRRGGFYRPMLSFPFPFQERDGSDGAALTGTSLPSGMFHHPRHSGRGEGGGSSAPAAGRGGGNGGAIGGVNGGGVEDGISVARDLISRTYAGPFFLDMKGEKRSHVELHHKTAVSPPTAPTAGRLGALKVRVDDVGEGQVGVEPSAAYVALPSRSPPLARPSLGQQQQTPGNKKFQLTASFSDLRSPKRSPSRIHVVVQGESGGEGVGVEVEGAEVGGERLQWSPPSSTQSASRNRSYSWD